MYKYRIKVLNRGRRSVSDISISTRIFIRGLNPERPTNLTSLHIPGGCLKLAVGVSRGYRKKYEGVWMTDRYL